MMVRFSCFSTPVNKSRKVVQQSVGKLLADCQSVTEDQSIKLVTGSIETNPMVGSNSSCNTVDRSISPCFQKECWQSDDLDAKLSEASEVIIRHVQIKKSHSLGNMMEKESDFYGDDIMGGADIDHGFSREYLNDWNTKEVRDSFGDTISSEFNHHENDGKSYHNKQKKSDLIKSRDLLTDSIHNDSLYSVENLKQSDHDQHADIAEQSADHFAISRCSSKKLPTLSRSCSVINLKVNVSESSEDTISHRLKYHRSHSFSDLNNFRGLGAEFQNHRRYFDSGINNEKTIIVSPSYLKPNSDGDGKAPCYFRAKEGLSLVRSEMVHDHDSDDDSRKLEAKDAEIKQSCRLETSHYNWEELTPEEFSLKRVEHWISQIDICGDFIVEEPGEGSANVCKEDPKISVDSRKPDARSLQAIEVPHNRISSLTSTSSSTQMANLGLVTVPVLSPFVSLRVVNLSGNVIARVTPGSLPKGLHMLNLSKNNISTIEGLRDLSHLRVLDLSYNRITKIGHGLSSCTSLKELYLAGNKISEVEGLHRLVKLNIIDLRFNKISTVKGLGQLAANYSSMQAINIEGNPAQINVGDEQLKKFLLGLLPNLVYYNKQAIRKGSKEVSGRSNFAAAAAPHFDRGIRAEHKLPLKASMSSGLHKLTKNHGRQSHVEVTSMKLTKDRHARTHLPHAATKPTNRHLDSGKKLLSEAMRRSQSTDALWSYVKS